MREVLNDLVRQTSGMFETVKVTATSDKTTIQGVDESKTLFVVAVLKRPVPEFVGEFGIGNLSLLKGLLGFASYRTDDATFVAKRETKPNHGETISQFEFRDANGVGSDFKTVAKNRAGEYPTISDIPWNVTLTPAKAKMAELAQLVALFAEVGDKFSVEVDDGFLILSLGEATSSTHSATMVLAENVTGELKHALRFRVSQFLSIIKIAGSNPMTVKFSDKGIAGITVETEIAIYDYYLRMAA